MADLPRPAFFEFDKAGAEWVVTAYLSQDPRMMDICEQGISPHPETAHFMTGAPVELIKREDDLLEHLTDPVLLREAREEHFPELLSGAYFAPRNMTLRQAGKRANHGLNYDLGYVTFALQYDMDQKDSRRIHGLYRKTYPGVPEMHKTIQRWLRTNDRTLRNCFGRKYRFLGAMQDELFKRGYSFIPQSSVADLLNKGILKIWRDPDLQRWEDSAREQALLDWEMLIQVHDSVNQQHMVHPNMDWLELAEEVHLIAYDYLNPTLCYHDREFKIQTDLKVSLTNWAHMTAVPLTDTITGTAAALQSTFEELWKMPRKLHDWLTSYLEYTEHTEPPLSFHTWSGIFVLASTLQRRVYMNWEGTIYPNQYIILVGPSGATRKGVAIERAIWMLRRCGVVLANSDSVTKEALVQDLKDSITSFVDTTTKRMRFQCSMCLIAEELAVFLGQKDIGMLTWLTKWYNSDTRWTYRTKNYNTDAVENLCFSILGGTASDWMESMLPHEAVGGGFTARCIFVVEDRKRKITPDPRPSRETLELRDVLLDDLIDIRKRMSGHIEFEPDAYEAYKIWYEKQEEAMLAGRPAISDPRFQAYLSRRQVHCIKLSIILSASRSNELKVTIGDFDRACALLETTEKKMPRAFGGYGRAKFSTATNTVLELLMERKTIHRSAILQQHRFDIDAWTLEQVERVLQQMGVIKIKKLTETGDVVYTFRPERAAALTGVVPDPSDIG